MQKLDLFLQTYKPLSQNYLKTCCDNENNIDLSESLSVYVCKECGKVKKDYLYQLDFYDRFKSPNIVKTYLPYNFKYKHICRLQQWSNYSYREVQEYKLLTEMDKIMKDKFDNDIISFSKILFTQLYKKLSIRAKIKDSLMVYCIFRISLNFKKEVNIDDLLLMSNITLKNYLDLNKKLSEDRLYIPKGINYYLKSIDYKIDKNYLILKYNKLLEIDNKFNNKSLVLGLIYYILDKDSSFCKKDFYSIFNISKTSIKNVYKMVTEFKDKIFDIN